VVHRNECLPRIRESAINSTLDSEGLSSVAGLIWIHSVKDNGHSGSNASTTRLEPRVCVFVSYACVIKPEVRYFRTLNRALTDRWLRGTKTPGTNAVRPVQDTGCSANILRLHHNTSYILGACQCKPSQSHPVLNHPSSFSIPSCYFLKCLSTIASI